MNTAIPSQRRSEIDYFYVTDVTFSLKHDIFGFQISVNHSIDMEAANSFNKLSSVKSSASLRELDVLAQVEEQLTTV